MGLLSRIVVSLKASVGIVTVLPVDYGWGKEYIQNRSRKLTEDELECYALLECLASYKGDIRFLPKHPQALSAVFVGGIDTGIRFFNKADRSLCSGGGYRAVNIIERKGLIPNYPPGMLSRESSMVCHMLGDTYRWQELSISEDQRLQRMRAGLYKGYFPTHLKVPAKADSNRWQQQPQDMTNDEFYGWIESQ